MKRLARTLFWWPGVDGEIDDLASACIPCVQAQPMPSRNVPVSWPETGTRWSRLHIDYAGPVDGRMLLIIVDSHTKWIEAIPVRSSTTEITIGRLRELFARFGLPRTIVSDNGPQFTSQQFAKFVADNGITHIRSAPYHPQSNGLAERAVRTVKDGLAKLAAINDLEKKLAQVLLGYRRAPLPCGKSPSELLLGYRLRSRLDISFPTPSPPSLQSGRPCQFQQGDPVWVRNFGQGERWSPGVIKGTKGSRLATVETPEGPAQRHFDQIRRRTPRTPKLEEPTGLVQKPEDQTPSQPEQQSPQRLCPGRASDCTSTPPPAVPAQSSEAPPELRRSSRVRKPVQRLQL